jgi:hypothetical protein
LAQLENIKNNSKNYQKIERIAEQKENDILNNRKAVVLAAVIAVLEALRNHIDNLHADPRTFQAEDILFFGKTAQWVWEKDLRQVPPSSLLFSSLLAISCNFVRCVSKSLYILIVTVIVYVFTHTLINLLQILECYDISPSFSTLVIRKCFQLHFDVRFDLLLAQICLFCKLFLGLHLMYFMQLLIRLANHLP